MDPEIKGDLPLLPSRASTSGLRLLTGLCVLLSLAMLITAGVGLYAMRGDAWTQAGENAHNIVLTLTNDIDRTLIACDTSIIGVRKVSLQPNLDQVPEPFRHEVLFDRATVASHVNHVLIVDRSGNVVDHQDPNTLPPTSLADREQFTFLRDHPVDQLYISRILRSRTDRGTPVTVLSRRISGADGQFLGIVTVGIRQTYFRDLFSNLSIGQHGLITLLRLDGSVLARFPSADDEVGVDLSGSDVFRHVSAALSGEYVGIGDIDHVRRLFAFSRVGSFPLIITVGFDVDDINADWQRRASVIAAVLIAFATAAMGLSLLFRRELLRRIKAEEAITGLAAKLSAMAATDELTSLANRRAFQARLENEWRRAFRGRCELALMMIDVDYFKLFNDGYGHLEGDNVLKLVAGAIAQAVHRSSDLAARYGGEEFCVLLPDTDRHGAIRIAEHIRQSVANLGISHDASNFGRVTVSVGVSSIVPETHGDATHLIHLADQALYRAKRDGRNMVETEYPGLTDQPAGAADGRG